MKQSMTPLTATSSEDTQDLMKTNSANDTKIDSDSL